MLAQKLLKQEITGFEEISGIPGTIGGAILMNAGAHGKEKETTKALIKGVVSGFLERNYSVGGFQAYITSDVLIGAGLSSSAAFETLNQYICLHLNHPT